MIRVIDFETTGLGPEDSCVCEAAFVQIEEGPTITDRWESLVKPTTAMDLSALATHHITIDEAESGGIPWDEAVEWLTSGVAPIHYAAHYADFDRGFFNPAGAYWIDTYKVALRLWPDSPSFSNSVLRYYLELKLDAKDAMPPHRAGPDAWVTANILLKALEKADLRQLIQWSNEPAYLTKIGFGKHRGKRFDELPRDYLEWLLRSDMEPAVHAAARRVLG